MRRLIVRSFPRLRRKPLVISWGSEDELLFYNVEEGKYRIWVHDCLRGATRRVLTGGIAHELCHVDTDLRMAPAQRDFAWARYFQSRWNRIREERATEQRVVELGYAPELLAFIHYTRRLGYSFTREHGLLEWEIERAVRKSKSRLSEA